jgi:hypothetical protein
VVQNAIIGPDTSLTGGLLGVAVLLALNAVVVRSRDATTGPCGPSKGPPSW